MARAIVYLAAALLCAYAIGVLNNRAYGSPLLFVAVLLLAFVPWYAPRFVLGPHGRLRPYRCALLALSIALFRFLFIAVHKGSADLLGIELYALGKPSFAALGFELLTGALTVLLSLSFRYLALIFRRHSARTALSPAKRGRAGEGG